MRACSGIGVTVEGRSGRLSSERFLTLAEVAEELNISVSQTYALVRSGDLQGIQIGGRNQWRVERVKLEEFITEAYRRTAGSLPDLPPNVDDEQS